MKNCTFPWTGMTIDPQGYLTLCCMIESKKGIFNIHISDVDSLYDFFYGEEYEKIQKSFDLFGWNKIKDCVACQNDKKQNIFTGYDDSQRFDPDLKTLQYLELTTSNTCNQQCVTCGSKFSSQWRKIEHYFDRPAEKPYSLSANDLEKVLEVLPDLRTLTLKGGEPFADMRNVQILESLFEINPFCRVVIVTNGVLIPQKFLDIIKKYHYNFELIFSIDAVGRKYDWIRGTPFDKTVKNLELVFNLGIQVLSIVPTISSYNIRSLNEITEWHNSLNIECNLVWNNIVYDPRWCSPIFTMTQKEIDSVEYLPMEIISQYDHFCKEELERNTKIMNKIRGFEFNSLQ